MLLKSDMHGSWDGRRGDAQTQSKESGSFGFLKEMAKNSASQFGKADTLENRLQMVTLYAFARDRNWLDDDDNKTTSKMTRRDDRREYSG